MKKYYQAALCLDVFASGNTFGAFFGRCLLPQEMLFWSHVHIPADFIFF